MPQSPAPTIGKRGATLVTQQLPPPLTPLARRQTPSLLVATPLTMDKKEKRVRCLCSTDITPHYARGRREIGEKLSFSMSRHFFFLLLYYYYSVSIFRRYLFICCMLSCLFGISLSITGKFANTRKVFIYLFFIFIFILVSYFFIFLFLFFFYTPASFKFAFFFFFSFLSLLYWPFVVKCSNEKFL